MAGRRRHPTVTGQQRCPDRLSKSDIRCVVGSKVLTQTPDPSPQHFMRIPLVLQCDKILKRLLRANSRDGIRTQMPSDNLYDFNVEQIRSMQGFTGTEDAILKDQALCRCKQQFQHSRCIDDDHRASLSRRTASAAEIETETGSRLRRRSRSSSIVGPSSAFLMVLMRYSDRDIPAIAALAFTTRCNASGKFRN